MDIPVYESFSDEDVVFEQFEKNTQRAGISHVIEPVLKTSAEAIQHIPSNIQLLFIDGAHEFEAVDMDYRLYAPKVIQNGFIAFHDTPWPGVQEVIQRVFIEDGFKNVYFTDCLMLGQKIDHPTMWNKIKNRWMLDLSQSFQAACRSRQPKLIRKIWKDCIKLCRDIIYHI